MDDVQSMCAASPQAGPYFQGSLQAPRWQKPGVGATTSPAELSHIIAPSVSALDHLFTPIAIMPDDAERAAPQNVQPAEAKELLDKEYTLLDVR